jgi:hypothetical protein
LSLLDGKSERYATFESTKSTKWGKRERHNAERFSKPKLRRF